MMKYTRSNDRDVRKRAVKAMSDYFLTVADELDEILIPYENAQGISYARQVVKNLKGKESIGVFIGPEGGFAEEEVEKAKNHGAKCITLGKRILRTETAALTALSILMFELEEEEA